MSAAPGLRIDPLDGADVDRLEPLWLALYDHHQSVAPELAAPGGTRLRASSWARRREFYEQRLRERSAFALVASRAGSAVGYAFVTVKAGPASWDLGDVVAELETLSVVPGARGEGIGTSLLRAVDVELERRGIALMQIAVAAANAAASRFYEREGARPYLVHWLRPVGRQKP